MKQCERVLLLIVLAAGLPLNGSAQTALGWPRYADASSTRAGNLLSSALVADLNGDGFKEIVVPAYDDYLYFYSHDGTSPSGWPRQLSFGDGTISSPAAGDIDSDGVLELVLFGDNSEGKTPKLKVIEVATTTEYVATVSTASDTCVTAKSTPAIINCMQYSGSSGHAGKEIIIRDGLGYVHIYALEGTTLSKKLTLDSIPESNAALRKTYTDQYNLHLIGPSASVKDLGGGSTLLVVPSTDGKVYVWQLTSSSGSAGNNLSATSLAVLSSDNPGQTIFFASGTLTDLDRDNETDLIVGGSDGKVYIWEIIGNAPGARTGWPKQAKGASDTSAHSILSTPAVGQLSGNAQSTLQIAIGSNDGHVYVWNADGTPAVSGGRLPTTGDVSGSPLIVDIDGTANGLEIMAGSVDGRLYLWGSDGDLFPGWPKRLNSPVFSSPIVTDLRESGRRSVVATGHSGTIFCFDLTPRYGQGPLSTEGFRNSTSRNGYAE